MIMYLSPLTTGRDTHPYHTALISVSGGYSNINKKKQIKRAEGHYFTHFQLQISRQKGKYEAISPYSNHLLCHQWTINFWMHFQNLHKYLHFQFAVIAIFSMS